MPNALATATSPYLRQHQDNPVDWQVWGDDAFARAQAENKPILLSVGYAACHWCHVMAHESFENEATARLMNENYVCVKVDREERPDVDLVYQSALSAFEGHGGWPLTMFITPDGIPFWGGTYFPPAARWGKPAFDHVLRSIAQVFRDSPDKVRSSAAEMARALQALGEPKAQGDAQSLNRQTLDRAASSLLAIMDADNGGIRGAPKFPNLTALDLLWRGHLRTGVAALQHAVVHALERISQGGIYDHLGGGYARYCVDEAWLVPHFEKMLYDNALFIDLLSTVWRTNHARLFEVRVRETVAWALREMLTAEGAFAASFDADSEGEEGKFYVWDEAEIDYLLGSHAPAFKKAYDVTAAGNWEHKVILNRLHAPTLGDAQAEAELALSRAKLFTVRSERVAPARDDKVLADWNGLMIAALVNAAMTFGERSWMVAAERAFQAIVRIHGTSGEHLAHSSFKGQRGANGFLDDYANMTRAALALHEATGKADYRTQAEEWIATIEAKFGAPDGGYFFAPAGGDARLVVRPRHANDSPQPSGNGTTAGVLARLYLLTGEDAFRTRAERLITAFGGMAGKYPVAFATLLNSFETLVSAQQIVVIGGQGQEQATDDLLAAAFAGPRPDRVVQLIAAGSGLPAGHPAAGKTQVGGKATAYVCTGQSCSLPVHTAEALSQLLRAA